LGLDSGVVGVTEVGSALLVQGAIAIIIIGSKCSILDAAGLALSIGAIA
jgi:hypothetical protein